MNDETTEQQIINQIEEIRSQLEAEKRPGLRCLAVVLDMLEDEDPRLCTGQNWNGCIRYEQIPDGILDLGMAILNSKCKLMDSD
jgi:hypothetical protein